MIRFKLKKLLEENNISMYKLSKDSGVRPNTISDWVNDDANTVKTINRETLNAICKALNCSVGDLIEYVPDKKNH